MYDTLLVNGTDIASLVSCIEVIDGLYATAFPRGGNPVIPGRDGEVWVEKPFDAGSMTLGLSLAGSTQADFNAALRGLREIIQPGSLLSLERHISYPTGNEVHVATGEWASGLSPTVSLLRFSSVSLGLRIHDGAWYASSSTTVPYSAGTTAISVVGETRTHRLTITVPPGSTITNTTTGHVLSNTLTSGGVVTIDVLEMMATQDGNDVSASMTWNKRYPFQLKAGLNSISSGTATGNITYTAAYL